MFVDTNGHFHIEMEVQGGDHNPNHYSERITAFLESEFEKLKNIDDKKFEETKDATLVNMNNKPLNVREAESLFYSRIVYKRLDMDPDQLDQIVTDQVKKITKENFLKFYQETFLESYRRLDLFCVCKKKIDEFKELLGKRTPQSEIFCDINKFKEGKKTMEDCYHISKLKN